MKYILLAILLFVLLLSCKTTVVNKTTYLASDAMLMAAPILESQNLFFTDSVDVAMKFSLPHSNIKYSIDDSEITTASKTYKKPIRLYESTVIKAKTFHSDYKSNTTTELQVVKTNSKLKGSKIEINPAPHKNYPGNGTTNLTDHIKGSLGFASDNAWLGFQTDSLFISINLKENTTLSKITLSALANYGGWIFLPKNINVFSGSEEIGTLTVPDPAPADATSLKFLEIPIKKDNYKNLEIRVSAVPQIPEWHQGKGTIPWLFIDEILVE